MTWAWVLAGVGLLVGGLGMTAAVAAASVRRVDLYRWVAHQWAGAQIAGAMLVAPWRVVSAANGVVTLGALAGALGLAGVITLLPFPLDVVVLLGVIVPVALFALYVTPRVVGWRWPEPLVRRAVPWIDRLAFLFTPFLPVPSESRARTALSALFQHDADDPLPGRDELTVLSGVLAFTERQVREVMTPRTDIVALREDASPDEIARLIADSGYSRIPVYRESLDNIIGMIYAFDLLKVGSGEELPLRPVAMAPSSKHCADLLFEMQRQRHQFAVILDEYGGTAGIATFEDLLEELVGEIFDEYDGRPFTEAPSVEIMEATGATPAEQIAARFDVDLPSQVETVGGLLSRAAGRIPRTGERLTVYGLEFDVLHATPNRVERVLIRRGPVPVVPLAPDSHR